MREELIDNLFAWILFGALLSLIIVICISRNRLHQIAQLKRQAIERGHAWHNPTNGVWEWREK